MKACTVGLIVAGGIAAGISYWSPAQQSPAPAAKPAPIIITNQPAGARGSKPYLSAGVSEVLKMHEAGVDKSVILAFVQNSSVAYHPSAKEVIYLRDEGIPPEIITAMLKRGGDLRDRAAELQREELRSRQFEQPAPVAPAPQPAEPAQPQSATAVAPQTTQVIYASVPVYAGATQNYISFPSYGYGYVRPSWYGYSYANCGSFYWPTWGAGFRSSCYPRFGLSVGFGGYHGGWRVAGGWHRCL